jgi:hypothetical protein
LLRAGARGLGVALASGSAFAVAGAAASGVVLVAAALGAALGTFGTSLEGGGAAAGLPHAQKVHNESVAPSADDPDRMVRSLTPTTPERRANVRAATLYAACVTGSAPEAAAFYVESDAARVERSFAWSGTPGLLWSVALAALVVAALLGGELPPWAYVVSWLVPLAVVVARRTLRGVTARRAPARISVDAESVTLERGGASRRFELAPEREGWATPIGDGRAVVALRARSGALVCFRSGASDAERALEAARATPRDRPLCITLERAGPWNSWLRWFGRGPVGARAVTIGALLVLVALEVRPTLYPLAAVLGLALVVAERALLLADPPRVVFSGGACRLAGLAHRSRVPLERIVSIDNTPRGTVLTSPDGSEIVLPIASGTPRRRGRSGPWTSEADLYDAQRARQAALVQALNAARGKLDAARFWS